MDGGRTRASERLNNEPRAHPVGPAAQKKTLIATEQDETARAAWRDQIAATPAETIVFLDETSTQTVMTRARGRTPTGTRVVGHVPRNHGHNITCLVAMSPTGITAPCVFERGLDGALFQQWVETWLLPALPPGTTIVLDNLSVHRNPHVRAAVERAGCQLVFLPAYSPDFNPIELVFAQLKTHLRALAARTFDAVIQAIGTGLAQVTPAHIRAYYRHCGYSLPDQDSQST